MTYQPAVYRKQGGDELVIASSGTVSLESGSSMEFESGSALGITGGLTFNSGGTCTFASGSTCTFASGSALTNSGTVTNSGTINTASGATLSVASGGISYCVPQTLTSATVSTTITPSGATFVTGTTTGPTYKLPTPVAGYAKDIVLLATSSGVTHRAVVYCNSTGRTIGNVVGDQGNQMTFATSACHSARIVASSSLAWRIVGYSGAAAPALSNYTTA